MNEFFKKHSARLKAIALTLMLVIPYFFIRRQWATQRFYSISFLG